MGKLALEKCNRSLGRTPRGTLAISRAHAKDGVGRREVVRWPHAATDGALLHCRRLPEVDLRGRPALPEGCRFEPRNSIDLLGPMLLRWKRDFLHESTILEHDYWRSGKHGANGSWRGVSV